ncbi:MAG: tRNA pseudouridine(38-40) synthase TruA [Betaproteobacteria bacterium]
MPSFRLTVAYDGTDFVGWQRQAAGVSIQGLLEDALAPLEDRRVAVTGAGRTDAGVHAEGQVAAVSLERWIDPATLVRAVNARLPPTVRVLDAIAVPENFHPRFDALAKTYRYRLFTGPVLSPFAVRYVWHAPGPLDVEAMSAAASSLAGEHDFSAFRSAGTDVERAIRVVYQSIVAGGSQSRIAPGLEPAIDAVGRGEYVTYTVRGSGFVRHMVRTVVGSLVEIGRGRRPPGWLVEVLESRDRAAAGPTAPPQGLALVRVDYPRLAAEP